MSTLPRRILLVAGDPSGDHYGADLLHVLRRLLPNADLYGYGGPAMAAAGQRQTGDLVALSTIGLADALPKLPKAKRLLDRLAQEVRAQPPDLAVLIDCGAFNLRLAPHLQAAGTPVLGYIPPGSWSASRKRAASVAKHYDAVASIFPQPLPAYAELGLPAQMVGHPLVADLMPVAQRQPLVPADPPVLAMLPGSRPAEIRYILPTMLATAATLRGRYPTLRLRVSQAASAPRKLFDQLIRRSGLGPEVCDGSVAALDGATAALVKSGTVSLEAALLGVPMVVVYRGSHVAAVLFGLYYWPKPTLWTLPNILAGEVIVPQWFQYQATPTRLAEELTPLLVDSEPRQRMVEQLRRAVAPLWADQATGGPRPAERAAAMALAMLRPPPAASP